MRRLPQVFDEARPCPMKRRLAVAESHLHVGAGTGTYPKHPSLGVGDAAPPGRWGGSDQVEGPARV